jgi:hypothetical protein
MEFDRDEIDLRLLILVMLGVPLLSHSFLLPANELFVFVWIEIEF